MRPAPKGGNDDEAIGRSRGGLSTKINIGDDALGNPVRFILTAGQVNDICQVEGMTIVGMYITPPLFRSSPERSLPGQIMSFHSVPGRGIRRPELTRLVTLESGASNADMDGSGTLLGCRGQ